MKNTFLLFLNLVLFLSFNAQITLINTGTTAGLYNITVVDNKIIIGGTNWLKRSNDECNTFITLTDAEPGWNKFLTRVDTNTVFILAYSPNFSSTKIYRSIDAGLSWVQTYSTSVLDIRRLAFFNVNEGIGICSNQKLLKTLDGGITWSVISGPATFPQTLNLVGDSTIIVGDVNPYPRIIVSQDKGNSWATYTMTTPYSISDVSLLNKDTLFVVPVYYNLTIACSFNGGSTIQYLPMIPGSSYLKGYFKNKNEGYILGQDDDLFGVIYKTTDLGQTWTTFNTGLINTKLFDIEFLNDSIALVSGSYGTLFKFNTKQTQFVGLKDNVKNNNGISIYPNPIKDKIIIEFENKNANDINFLLTNSLGQPIPLNSKTINNKLEIDTSELPEGIYYLKVQNNSGQKVFKVIKG